jgi:hypothetical protein
MLDSGGFGPYVCVTAVRPGSGPPDSIVPLAALCAIPTLNS